MHEFMLGSVKFCALVRSAWLLIGLVRIIPVHVRARTRKWGLAEVLALVELPTFLALTLFLVFRPPAVPADGTTALVAGGIGSLSALCGVLLSVWAIYTTVRRSVILDAGHFIKQEHPLVTTGAYGFVRNPMYLGIILIWFGIAIAFQNPFLLAVAVLYVWPVFWFYIRAEERMLSTEFGARFEEYQRGVGRLLPRILRSAGEGSLS